MDEREGERVRGKREKGVRTNIDFCLVESVWIVEACQRDPRFAIIREQGLSALPCAKEDGL